MSSGEFSTAMMMRSQQQQHSHFNNPSTSDSFSFPSSQSHNPQCRGSLPLKKRRFLEITSLHNHHLNHGNHSNASAPSTISAGNANAAFTSSSVLQQQQDQQQQHTDVVKNGLGQLVSNASKGNITTVPTSSITGMSAISGNLCPSATSCTRDEKFAALALVAAASASTSANGGVTGIHGNINNGLELELQPSYTLPSAVEATSVTTSQALSMGYAPLSVVSASAVASTSAGHSVGISTPLQAPSSVVNDPKNAVNLHESLTKRKKQQHVSNNRSKEASVKKTANTNTLGTKSSATKNGQQRQRVNHPPLSAPIPGGCHGRTSRNNSYCRRTPCYNGSNYCKLHYQQYMNNSNSNNSNNNYNRSSAGKNDRSKAEEKGTKHQKNLTSEGEGTKTGTDVNQINHTNSSSHRHHQDKRYNPLCANEVQCLATTTRGRPCAYVAVSGTKYCHLHADYDTNPPPRRGGSGGSQKCKSNNTGLLSQNNRAIASSTSSSSSTTILPNNVHSLMTMAKIASMQVSSSTTPTLSATSSVDVLPALSPSSNGKAMMEESKLQGDAMVKSDDKSKDSSMTQMSTTMTTLIHPTTKYPLLNSIPSDKWSNKKVLIGTGPLVNHVGRVTKWGNGWVTVSMTTGSDDIGSDPECNTSAGTEILHNRRAIELYLIPHGTTTVSMISKRNGHNASLLTNSSNITTSNGNTITDIEKNRLCSQPSSDMTKKVEILSQNLPTVTKQTEKEREMSLLLKSSIEVTKASKKLDLDMHIEEEKQNKKITHSISLKKEPKKVLMQLRAGANVIQSLEDNKEKSYNEGNIEKVKRSQDKDICETPLKNENKTCRKEFTSKTTNVESSTKLLHDESSLKVEIEKKDNIELKNINREKEDDDAEDSVESLPSEEAGKDAEKNKLLLNISKRQEMNKKNENANMQKGRKLTLMEELILAQTGRRVKNVDLALYSGGGRTIQKPIRYEDKTLIKKKRGKQHSDCEQEEEVLSPKRKKMTNSPKVRMLSLSKSPDNVSSITRKDTPKDTLHSVVADSQKGRRRIEKVK